MKTIPATAAASLLLLAACWAARSLSAREGTPARRPRSFASMQQELEPTRTVAYKTVDDEKLELHLFYPPHASPADRRPAFVAIHGGGWRSGTPRRFYPYAHCLVAKGYVGVSVGYRLVSPKRGRTVFDCVRDGRSAVRYLRSHAADLGIDPNRITVAGGSAGGHVAAGTALFDGVDDPNDASAVSCAPNALVLLFAVLDTSPAGYGNKLIGPDWKSISPLHQIKPGCPPTLIFHGGKDNVTPLATVRRYAERMTDAKNVCELVIEPDGPHGHLNRDMKLFDQAAERIAAFLKRQDLAPTEKEASGPPDQLPRVFVLDGKVLMENRRKAQAGDKDLQAALAALIRAADAKLAQGPFSVTDKASPPPSGDKHDYRSLGPYWWPDPKKPDGKPYVRKDGQVNPERNELGDSGRFGQMQKAVTTLATAWYFTGREQYAAHAAKLLRTWYLAPATRMNPNMNYAQAIPGRCTGRGIGIVDASRQPMLIDAVGMLRGSKAWTERDQKGLVNWFDQFLHWLQTSQNGQDEDRTRNNHATQYDAQVASYALFVGKPEIAAKVLRAVGPRRIDTQIEPDGSQPLELARTKSWDYSCANTRNFTRLAALARHVDVDLWNYRAGGRSINKAIDYLLPYAAGKKKWTARQIRTFAPGRLLTPLLQAAPHDPTGRYARAAADLLPDKAVERLLYPPPRK